jgi:isopentenyl-diphosphate delta-isomerase
MRTLAGRGISSRHLANAQENDKMPAHILIPAIAGDGSLFPMEKMRVHEQAQFHLAVSVFVFDRGELLIQRRARSKYHCGGLWANTCCTHPHWTETLTACAARRLREELGFSLPLVEKCVVEYSADVGGGLHEHERVTFFTAEARREDFRLAPNPLEVEEVRWISPAGLHREIAEDPSAFTPWFRIYAERFPKFEIPNN